MDTDQRKELFDMARHKFGLYSRNQLREEYKRKLFMEEYYIDDYPIALTAGELLALFETLIQERRCPKSTTSSCAEIVGGTGTTKKTPPTPSVGAGATTSPSAKGP